MEFANMVREYKIIKLSQVPYWVKFLKFSENLLKAQSQTDLQNMIFSHKPITTPIDDSNYSKPPKNPQPTTKIHPPPQPKYPQI